MLLLFPSSNAQVRISCDSIEGNANGFCPFWTKLMILSKNFVDAAPDGPARRPGDLVDRSCGSQWLLKHPHIYTHYEVLVRVLNRTKVECHCNRQHVKKATRNDQATTIPRNLVTKDGR